MKNYQDKIDSFIKGKLTEEEVSSFENEMDQNPELRAYVQEQIKALRAIQVDWSKNSWASAASKWLLIKAGIAALIVLTIGATSMFIFKSSKKQIADNNNINQAVQTHSTTNEANVLNDSIVEPLSTTLKDESTLYKVKKEDRTYNFANHETREEFMPIETEPYESDSINLSKARADSLYLALKTAQFNVSKIAQYFSFEASKDQLIVGENGTKIAIPANSLLDGSGNLLQGTSRLELIEFVTLYDLIDNGLSTQTQSGVLSTGGSCYIMIYDSLGRECKLAKNKAYTVEFNSAMDPEMLPYVGSYEDSVLVWSKAQIALDQNRVVPIQEISEEKSKLNFDIIDNRERGIFSDAPRIDRSSRYGFGLKAINKYGPDEEINKAINDSTFQPKAFEYFDTFKLFNPKLAFELYRKWERTLKADTLRIHYKINANGELDQYSIDKKLKGKSKRQLKRFARSQGKQTLFDNWNGGEKEFTLCLYPQVNYTLQERLSMKTDSMLAEEKAANLTIKHALRNKITFSSLGFINADKPYNPKKYTDVTLTNPEGLEGYVYVVIDESRSVMRLPLNGSFRVQKTARFTLVAILKDEQSVNMSVQRNLKAFTLVNALGTIEEFDASIIKKAVD